MSDDPTRILPAEKGMTTQPMLDTILERINQIAQTQGEMRAEMNTRFDRLDERVEQVEIELDRLRIVAHDTRGDLRELRRELRDRDKQPV